jgi:hypothetical protein
MEMQRREPALALLAGIVELPSKSPKGEDPELPCQWIAAITLATRLSIESFSLAGTLSAGRARVSSLPHARALRDKSNFTGGRATDNRWH